MGFSGGGMFEMWDVPNIECSGAGMFGIRNVKKVGYLECVMFRKWHAWNVECLECRMFGM